MKIIFLDIDGVLNNTSTTDKIGRYRGLEDSLIQRFNRIIEAVPETKIVISSSWRRFHTLPELTEILRSRGLKGDIIGTTPTGRTDRPWMMDTYYVPRGHEIREYLQNCLDTIDTFVILDDMDEGMKIGGNDPYSNLYPNFVQTSEERNYNLEGDYGGLQDRHVEEAIRILRT